MIIGSREPRSVVDPHVPRISIRPATSRRALSTRKANSNNFTVATDKENLDPLPSARSKEKKDRPSSSREKKKRPKAKALDGVAPCVISEEAQAAAVAASPCNASNATVAAADAGGGVEDEGEETDFDFAAATHGARRLASAADSEWRKRMVFYEGDERATFFNPLEVSPTPCDPTSAVFDPT